MKNDQWLDYLAEELEDRTGKRPEEAAMIQIEDRVPWEMKVLGDALDIGTGRSKMSAMDSSGYRVPWAGAFGLERRPGKKEVAAKRVEPALEGGSGKRSVLGQTPILSEDPESAEIERWRSDWNHLGGPQARDVTAPSIPLPAVLVTKRDDKRVPTILAGLVAAAVLLAGGFIGGWAIQKADGNALNGQGSVSGASGPAVHRSGVTKSSALLPSKPSAGDVGDSAGTKATGRTKGFAPSPKGTLALAPAVVERDDGSATPGETMELSAVIFDRNGDRADRRRGDVGDRARSRDGRRSTSRRGDKGAARPAWDPVVDRDVDINRLPTDPSFSVHNALAKVQPKSAEPASAAARAPAAKADSTKPRSFHSLLTEASRSGSKAGSDAAKGQDGDLEAAIRDDGRDGSSKDARAREKTPELPARLGARQVAAWSGKLTHAVRKCAHRFGFARVSVPARVTLQGQSGRVVGMSLGGRFSGSPMESCAKRAAAQLSAPKFKQSRQTLQLPVYVP